jgi:polysaccharide export outer membrane protein
MTLRSDGARAARRFVRSALVLALATLGFACAKGATPPPDGGPMDRPEYVIGPADVLRIRVWKQPELSVDVPVRPDGKITVPLANDVQASGLTTNEVRDVISKALSDYVAAPDVTVIVTQVNSKRVQVMGEVTSASMVALTQEMRVIDALAASRGFTPYADKSDIRILRPNPDGSVIEYRFNYNAFLRGKNPETNMRLQSGDTIVVPD